MLFRLLGRSILEFNIGCPILIIKYILTKFDTKLNSITYIVIKQFYDFKLYKRRQKYGLNFNIFHIKKIVLNLFDRKYNIIISNLKSFILDIKIKIISKKLTPPYVYKLDWKSHPTSKKAKV